jgi:hypothetical protein
MTQTGTFDGRAERAGLVAALVFRVWSCLAAKRERHQINKCPLKCFDPILRLLLLLLWLLLLPLLLLSVLMV